MSSDDWLAKVKEMRQNEASIKASIKEGEKVWAELKEKYKGEATRIIETLNTILKKVAEVYTEQSLKEYDKPKVEGDNRHVELSIPITHEKSYGSGYRYSISFWLRLSEKGYGLEVLKNEYSVRDERSYERQSFIPPPVTETGIQKEVMDVLETRNRNIKEIARKEEQFRREWG